MKKNRMQISTLLTLLLCMLLLTACGASTTESEGTDPETPPQESAAAPETEELLCAPEQALPPEPAQPAWQPETRLEQMAAELMGWFDAMMPQE